MRNYVIINGVNSLTIPGLAIKDLPPISKPLMRNQKETVDGRNGDLITKLGYSAYDKTMTIGLYGNYDINQIIAFFNQEGTIVFSDEDDKYYNFKILEQIDFAKLVKFRTADVRIHCQPFKYPLVEEPIVIELEAVEDEGTSATLNNTAEAPLKIDLEGNTYQETTTGKNLLNAPLVASTYDLTYNSTTGYISGVCGNYNEPTILELDTPQYVTFSYKGDSANQSVYFSYTYENDTIGTYYPWSGGDENTLTPIRKIKNVIVKTRDKTRNNNFRIMLEIGQEPTAFELFTYGKSPNPQYPQEVQVVTGDNTIVVRSANLFDKNATTEGAWLLEDGTLSLNHNNYWTSDYILVQPNTAYYKRYSGSVRSKYYDKNKVPLNTTTYQDIPVGGGAGTFTTPSNCYYVRVTFSPGNNMTLDNFMINLGTTDMTYVSAQSQEYEVDLGVENLMPYSTYDASEQRNMQMPDLQLNAGTYTISFDLDSFDRGTNTNFDINMNLAYEGGGSLDTRIIRVDSATTTGRKSATFTLANNTTATISNNIRISTTQYDNGARAELNNIQIEKGSKANSYSEYGDTPIELCKIGTYKDYLYKSGDKWYKHTEIGKVVLDGTDTSTIESGSGTNTYRFRTANDTLMAGTNGLCSNNQFVTSGVSTDAELVGITGGYIYYRINKSIIDAVAGSTNKEKFNNWLSNHNTDLYVPLITPAEEEITNSDLINQLDSLLGAMSYLDQTNVNQENSNLAFNMKVSAMKKGSNEAVINNTGNIYAKPILELEGSGISGIYIGNTQLLSIDMISDITIDTELMEAYDPDTLQLRNRQITGSYENIKLEPGNTTMKVSGGITKVTIKNWKRWL